MASGASASWTIWAALGVVGLKVVVSAAQLPGQAAPVAITWLVTILFVTVGVLLLRTDVPAVNGWGCILVALSTVPGDLNDPPYARLGLSPAGFVLEAVYLVAASALVLRYPRSRLSTRERWLLIAILGGRGRDAARRGDDDGRRCRRLLSTGRLGVACGSDALA